MTGPTQLDLIPRPVGEEPTANEWYAARFVSWAYIASPTRGEMRRLVGEIVGGSCAGQVIWKPLTHDLAGCRWVERALKTLGFPQRQFAALRRPGLGHYLDALCAALVGQGEIRVTIYPFQRQSDGQTTIYWTVEKVKKP